jgi:hypothetical protein
MHELSEGWYVSLVGDQPLVHRLLTYPCAATLGMFLDVRTNSVVLRIGTEFVKCTDAQDAAEARIKTLHGLLKVAGCWCPRLSADDPFQVLENGKRISRATLSSIAYLAVDVSSEAIRYGLFHSEVPAKPYLARLNELSAYDGIASKILRFMATPDANQWTGLYRVLEVIEEEEGGESALIAKGWTSAKQAKRFDRSANSPSASGDAARHGRDRYDPPKNPMTLEEGQAYVLMLVQSWFAERLTEFEQSKLGFT